jgi:hypothetical protein
LYRFVSFIVIFSFVTIMLYFHNQNSHYQASNNQDAHMHETVDIPAGEQAPSIKGEVMEDHSGSWLLQLETRDFEFAPKKAGMDEISYGEGHAHLYVDGEKINRLYGNYYNLGELEPGTHHIKVTLNANNHGVYTVDGREIAYEEAIRVK